MYEPDDELLEEVPASPEYIIYSRQALSPKPYTLLKSILEARTNP